MSAIVQQSIDIKTHYVSRKFFGDHRMITFSIITVRTWPQDVFNGQLQYKSNVVIDLRRQVQRPLHFLGAPCSFPFSLPSTRIHRLQTFSRQGGNLQSYDHVPTKKDRNFYQLNTYIDYTNSISNHELLSSRRRLPRSISDFYCNSPGLLQWRWSSQRNRGQPLQETISFFNLVYSLDTSTPLTMGRHLNRLRFVLPISTTKLLCEATRFFPSVLRLYMFQEITGICKTSKWRMVERQLCLIMLSEERYWIARFIQLVRTNGMDPVFSEVTLRLISHTHGLILLPADIFRRRSSSHSRW